MARITFQNADFYLGVFQNPEEAYKAYCNKAKELHGEFANAD